MSSEESDVQSGMTVGAPTQKIIPVCESLITENTKKVVKDFVFDVYDKIAPHFSHTRYASVFYATNFESGTKCGLASLSLWGSFQPDLF